MQGTVEPSVRHDRPVWLPRRRRAGDALTHVVVELEPDHEGWPPVGAERVWAEPVGRHRYRIDNIPFFAMDLATDDVVEARPVSAGQHPTLVRVVKRSPHATLRVVCFRAGPLRGDLVAAAQRLGRPGVATELADAWGIVALCVAPSADVSGLKEALDAGTDDGSWEYEEGRLSTAWLTATATG
ncbi:MAG TPA: DUF4265 domain-containing protein [Friedmanniella sp.]